MIVWGGGIRRLEGGRSKTCRTCTKEQAPEEFRPVTKVEGEKVAASRKDGWERGGADELFGMASYEVDGGHVFTLRESFDAASGRGLAEQLTGLLWVARCRRSRPADLHRLLGAGCPPYGPSSGDRRAGETSSSVAPPCWSTGCSRSPASTRRSPIGIRDGRTPLPLERLRDG